MNIIKRISDFKIGDHVIITGYLDNNAEVISKTYNYYIGTRCKITNIVNNPSGCFRCTQNKCVNRNKRVITLSKKDSYLIINSCYVLFRKE